MESRTGTNEGHAAIIVRWHGAETKVIFESTEVGPRIEVAWMAAAESGVRVFLDFAEAELLADTVKFLVARVTRRGDFDGDLVPPDWAQGPF
ncbi:hypothetical protein [Nocardia seriolae]|nr:hypothetical protein [Nocardia seriolae]MTJ60829.1 hypothetical protein [Nocardia seriolae]MTJ76122.1 hypothetical protein [Nocardia seriolae]MTJ91029.1 hypothetical protein [Nocardia seriolae]MTK34991.1 hypothetical protein [Nocardia seriolae]MTK38812.1 hypothetical protein [Nocardia seriolae]